MNSAHALRIISCVLFFLTLTAQAATVNATYNFPTDVPITASSYTATGNTVTFTLNCVPTANVLTVVKNTGPAFIQGTFSNLAQGQAVALSFNSITYNFVANYYGGSGRDLVLVRSGARAFATGANTNGQLGDNTKTQRNTPVAVSTAGAGVLFGKTVVSVAAGELHSLALCSDGTLAAWGFNYDGELGTNSITQALVPVAVNTAAGLSSLAGKTVVAIAAGELHSLALCSDGTVSAWGHNYEGELGNNSTGDSLVPVAVNTTAGVSALDGKTVTAVAAGALHNLALCSDGTVAAWGYNYDGELGNNSTTDSPVPVAVDRSGVLSGKTVVAVAAGSSHSLALCSDGTLAAWGNNTYGQLGTNTTTSSLLPVAVNTVSGVSALAGKTVTSIAAGAYHSMALCSDGTVIAWGYNGVGQLGDNSATQRLAPVAVNTAASSALLGRTVEGIQAGQYHSVAQCSDGTAAAWGSNFNGQLGDNTTTQRNVPVAVATPALAAGERFVLAGSGANASHTLGLVAAVPPAVPLIAVEQPVGTGLGNGATFDFGSWVVGNPVPLTFTIRNKGTSTLTGLTITKDGSNSAEFVVAASPTAPVAPGSATTFTVIFTASAAGVRTAALHLASNDAANSTFHLNLTATGTLTGGVSAVFNSPTDIPITASGYTATGNTIGITLNCVPTANELTVVKNTGLAFIQGTFSNLAQGQAVTLTYAGITYNMVANYYGGSGNDLVLVWKGTRVVAWGINTLGEIGDNSTVNRKIPVEVNTTASVSALAGKTATSVAFSFISGIALCSDGTVAAWGQNTGGQLGNSLVPVAVNTAADSALFGKTVAAVAAGLGHNLALCSDGTMAAWGSNTNGQLGNNSQTNSFVPVAVNNAGGSALFGKTVAAIVGGKSSSLALCSDGTIAAWGANSLGQLGSNIIGNSLIPVAVNKGAGSALFGMTVAAVAAGENHILALCSDGTLVAWGDNSEGQLGDNTTTQQNVPVAVNTAAGSALFGKTVVAAAGGRSHSLALCSDGTLVAWGNNTYGQLGTNSTTRSLLPVAVNTDSGVSALAGKTIFSITAGPFHSLALCSDGTVVAWGYNNEGSLGDSTTTQRNVPVAVDRTLLTPNERFNGVAAGGGGLARVSWPGRPLVNSLPVTSLTTTGATLNGNVNANGNSTAVTFEYGTTPDYGTTVAASPALLTGTSTTAVGFSLTGLIPGTLYHYRVNADSVHGDDQTFSALQSSNPDLAKLIVSEGALSPVFASGTTQYTATVVSAADSITVIPTVADYGTVTVNGFSVATGITSSPIPLAVGANTLTIVGTSQDGTATKTYTVTVTRPAETQTLNATWNSPMDVPATTSHYTATGNTVNLTLNCIPLANELMILKNTGPAFIQGAFSNLAHGQAVALTYAGQTYNFVANYYGGNGNDLVLVWTGTRVVGCGQNSEGEIGDGTVSQSAVPVSVNGTGVLAGKTVISVAAGFYYSVALCSDGTVASWGRNVEGQLGNGSTTDSFVPIAVNTAAGSALFGKTVVAIAAGYKHSIALCSDGTVAAWGYNGGGEIGDNSIIQRNVPVAVNTATGSALFGKTVVAVAAGYFYSLALCSDGSVVAWGFNNGGSLGDNSTAQRNIPVAVNTAAGSALFGKTVVAIAAGSDNGSGQSLALCSDGTLAGWGYNGFGQLGNNSTANSLVPTAVNTAAGSALFGKTAVAVSAGYFFSLALCSDGTVAVWGRNGGVFGNDTTTDSLIPVAVSTAAGSALFGKTVVGISASLAHSRALCSDGTVAAWGLNQNGQLGDNTTTQRNIPVAVNRASLSPSERFSGIESGNYDSIMLVSSSVQPPAPTCSTAAVSNLTLASVQLNGSVNGQGYDTTAAFEYGTNGTTFPNTINLTTAGLNGISDVAVSTALSGLLKGTTYYYRVKAANQGGITISATQSFITRTEPTAATGTASAVSTTSVQLTGTLDAHGSDTAVFFDYGTSAANLSFSISASPAVATGYGNTVVSAVLNNLSQGAVYYRIRGTSVAGVGTSMTGSFQVATLSGFNQIPPRAIPEEQRAGFIVVNLTPSSIGEGWRFVGEQQWRVAGVPVGGLATGNREIEFRPVPGYLHPLREPVSVVSGAAARVVEREYFSGGGGAAGSLGVTLLPASLGVGAQWRLLGEGDSAWRASGASLGGLAAGVYLVECKEVSGYATPRPISVTIGSGEAKSATATYFLADAAVGAQPGVVGFDAVTSATANPSTYVGQLRSDSGAGTGFVVRERVVATAAHVVFDDVSFSAVTGLQWLFQRERGTYEPVPQIPRGSYILSGYSAARQSAGVIPGQSTADSQNLDVASVWFHEKDEQDNPLDPLAARGGKGGYLASDSTDNEWLISPRLKTIVGYPLDGIATANQGRIHATPPINGTFTHANARVYLTDAITSRGGNSGGPVCVQYDDGRYFPAAIYLGGSTQTRVRAIDSDVIALFDVAEGSSRTGENSNSGGETQTNTALASTPAGTLTVTIEPQAARAAGAGWRIGNGAFLTSGQSKPYLSAGNYTVTFKSIEGFQTPSSRNVNITGGNTTTNTGTYIFIQPAITSVTNRAGEKDVSFTHQITTDSPVTTFGLSGTLPGGLTFNSSLGRISGTPTVSGDFALTVNVENAYGGTDTGPLRIKIPPKITNTTTLVSLTQSQSFSFQTTTPGDNSVSYAAPGLPDGITLDATGLISGTPTVSGSFEVDVSATNAGGIATHHLTINVAPQTIGGSTASGLTGQVFSKYKVTVKEGDAVTSYALSGALPDGLFFLADIGEIVGTPTEGGIFPVTVSATNAGGTSSQLVTISINPVLTFAKVGNGTVSPLLAPATEQTPGATVMLTAQAAEGSFFAGWTGDVPSSERVLTFAMDGNRSVQANFRTFAAMKASYSGLVQKQQPTYSDTGLMTLTLTAKGSFSGKLQLAGASYKVSGVFGSDGKYSGSVSRGKVLSALPLELYLGVAGVTGEITLDSTAIPFLLTPPAFNSKTNKAPQAGSYTFTFPHPADTAQPQGDGYATAMVSASGVVALAGALGDGSVISVGGNLTSDGEWAVFAPPYGGKGLFAGTLTFHDDTIDFVDGAVFWSKPEIMKAKKYPGAFTADIAVLGSRWTPPARNTAALDITNWNLAIGNGVLAPPVIGAASLSSVNIFTLTGAPGIKLTLATKTGLLSGSFPGANGKPVKFNGALLQSQRIGRGVFALPDKTGPVTLDVPY